jgi:hypothetical protein
MPYVIYGEGKYLTRDVKGNYSVVNSLEMAKKWNAIIKVNNILKHQGKKFKDKYNMEIKYVSQENKIINPIATPIELEYEILDKVKQIHNFSKNIEERRLYLVDMIHATDLAIVDIEHAAEFYNLNASQGYKLYKMLHNERVKRREYKDELQKIDLVLGTAIRSEYIEKLEKSIVGMDNRKYEPRVNKELFGV